MVIEVKSTHLDSENTEAEGVREKASHRKGRTSKVIRAARVPAQERSRVRYQSILDATIELLKTANIEDISLHDIGKATALPPASVHYLFSTMTAIHVELNSYFNEFLTRKILDHSLEHGFSKLSNWQDLVRVAMSVARDELNSNRPMSEIMLGPVLHRSMRVKNLETNRYHGDAARELFDQYFIVPEIPNIATYLMYSAEMSDGLWIGSYARHGRIDDETFEESVRACVAYMRCYFPDTMAKRIPE